MRGRLGETWWELGRARKADQLETEEWDVWKYSRDCAWPRRPWPNAGRREKSRENDLFFWGKKKLPKKNIFFLHISSSYAKILSEKLFRTWEIPRSGLKAEDGGERERERERERLNNGENNGQATHGARKHAWNTQAAWAKKTAEQSKV